MNTLRELLAPVDAQQNGAQPCEEDSSLQGQLLLLEPEARAGADSVQLPSSSPGGHTGFRAQPLGGLGLQISTALESRTWGTSRVKSRPCQPLQSCPFLTIPHVLPEHSTPAISASSLCNSCSSLSALLFLGHQSQGLLPAQGELTSTPACWASKQDLG